MNGKARMVGALLVLLLPIAHAAGDDLQDAYDAGFKEGKKKGYDEGHRKGFDEGKQAIQILGPAGGGRHVGTGTTFQVPGSAFSATIVPNAGTTFQVTPDSSIAIIPNRSLDEFQQKLGSDFLKDKKIILNDGPAAP